MPVKEIKLSPIDIKSVGEFHFCLAKNVISKITWGRGYLYALHQ